MPIQIRSVKSLREVERRISAYEEQFSMSSQDFMEKMDLRATVPEFDAIEWNFLLMQKTAMQEDDACGPPVIWSSYKSHISTVDPRKMYEDVAA